MASTTRPPETAPARTTLAGWFLIGLLVALFLQGTQAVALGGWSGLLAVGENATVRPLIEADLPGLAVVEGSGHDGQIGYAISLDLDGSEVPDLLVDPGYRYRRILVPFVASAAGLLRGRPLLATTIGLSALGMALASAALESIRRRFAWSGWVHLAILANPGLWMSVRLLTPDAVALGLATAAVGCYLAGRYRWTILALALAVLAKDQYLLVALSLAGHRWFVDKERDGVALVAIPALVLAVWSGWLQLRFGDGFTARGNLTWPGGWLPASSAAWGVTSAEDRFLVAVGIAALAAGLYVAFTTRSALLRWLLAPWILMAAVSSDWVWAVGNNVVRVFAPLVALLMVAVTAALPARAPMGSKPRSSSLSG